MVFSSFSYFLVINRQIVRSERAVVIIAHRLSTIMYADNIIVLENRRVVKQGTHDELMARNGAYTTLVKNQAPTNVKKDAME